MSVIESKLMIDKFQPLFFKDFDAEMDRYIIELLQSLMDTNNINILLCGSSGCGKTTFVNAIVREYFKGIQKREYSDNVLYINSLKEQGINYYRTNVKSFCQTMSAIRGKKKIVILDDIDIVNEQSQQVFRNCMDSYTKNVFFIASCNNIQKVIENIQSRLLVVSIKPLDHCKMKRILKQVTNNENINIDDAAADFVVDICNNSVKALINYAEKFKLLGDTVTINIAKSVCTNISFNVLENYIELVKKQKLKDAIHLLYTIYNNGYSVTDILDTLFVFVKITPILKEPEKYELIKHICKYISVFNNIHEDKIELALFTNNICERVFDSCSDNIVV